ncbi:MAG: hypothetical protein PHV68_01490 [Candidatus Gastranaerophilales bacterium]|nr:hypothetical protein [Candidatus Gastranaerophilales bacterium]
MLNSESIGFRNSYSVHPYNKSLKALNKHKNYRPIQRSNEISFNGNINFILINKGVQAVGKNQELKHISNVLKTLGVKELEIGDNLDLAKLLKSAMLQVKKSRFDVPTRIKCESAFFEENKAVQANLRKMMSKQGTMGVGEWSIPGVVKWNGLNEPVLYFNTKNNWNLGNGVLSKNQDSRHAIFHETGHWLHMMKYKNNPQMFKYLENIELDSYQKGIVNDTIGTYASENPVPETIAEIFARLMSKESYSNLHPEIFNIYTKYNGPMPKKI